MEAFEANKLAYLLNKERYLFPWDLHPDVDVWFTDEETLHTGNWVISALKLDLSVMSTWICLVSQLQSDIE